MAFQAEACPLAKTLAHSRLGRVPSRSGRHIRMSPSWQVSRSP